MGRSRGDSESSVSLFPFLSILACVIGTLVLLITSVAICQMESPAEEALVARVEEYRKLEKEQKDIDRKLASQLPKLHELEQYKAALAKLEALLARLREEHRQKLSENKDAKADLAELLARMKQFEALLAKLELEKRTLEEQLAALRAELERRKRVQDAPTVCIMPARDSRRDARRPVFVEADGDGLLLDPDGKRERVPRAGITTDATFKGVVDAVAADRKKVMVFLIREDGVLSYRTAESFARRQSALVAKLPIIGDGKLDLSRF